MWCCLFLTILQNEIQDFPLQISFELSTLGSERVKRRPVEPLGSEKALLLPHGGGGELQAGRGCYGIPEAIVISQYSRTSANGHLP